MDTSPTNKDQHDADSDVGDGSYSEPGMLVLILRRIVWLNKGVRRRRQMLRRSKLSLAKRVELRDADAEEVQSHFSREGRVEEGRH